MIEQKKEQLKEKATELQASVLFEYDALLDLAKINGLDRARKEYKFQTDLLKLMNILSSTDLKVLWR